MTTSTAIKRVVGFKNKTGRTLSFIIKIEEKECINFETLQREPMQVLSICKSDRKNGVACQTDFSKYVKNNPETPILYRGVDGDLFFDAETLIEDLKYGDVTWLGSSSCLSGVGIYFVGAVGKDIGEIEARKYGQVVCKCCVDLSKVEPIDWKKLENLYGDYAKNMLVQDILLLCMGIY